MQKYKVNLQKYKKFKPKCNSLHKITVSANDYRGYIIASGVFVLVTVTGSLCYLRKKLKRLLSLYVISLVTMKAFKISSSNL